jgi:hypothetical protein
VGAALLWGRSFPAGFGHCADAMLDDIWLREFSDLKPPGSPAQFFLLMRYDDSQIRGGASLWLSSFVRQSRDSEADTEIVSVDLSSVIDKMKRVKCSRNLTLCIDWNGTPSEKVPFRLTEILYFLMAGIKPGKYKK